MPAPERLWSGGDPPREPLPRHADPFDPPPERGRIDPRDEPVAAGGGRRPRLGLAVLAAVTLVGAGVGGTLLAVGSDDGPGSDVAPLPAAAAVAKDKTIAGSVFTAASPAVATILANGSGGQGTGFLVDGVGTIVTNAHVIGDATSAKVAFGENDAVPARILGTDPSSDIAVLRVPASAVKGVKPLALADSEKVSVGESVVAIGNPFGLDRTITAGIVSAKGRSIEAPNGFAIDEVIQTDAPINPGNSGGPLLDASGQVIGVNSQILTGGASSGNVGVGFAVPANTVRDVVPRLERGEAIKRPFLGISTTETRTGTGALIAETTTGGPGASSGLRVGDTIVKLDGGSITEPSDVAAAIADKRPGDEVAVVVQRAGVQTTVKVSLGTRPASTP